MIDYYFLGRSISFISIVFVIIFDFFSIRVISHVCLDSHSYVLLIIHLTPILACLIWLIRDISIPEFATRDEAWGRKVLVLRIWKVLRATIIIVLLKSRRVVRSWICILEGGGTWPKEFVFSGRLIVCSKQGRFRLQSVTQFSSTCVGFLCSHHDVSARLSSLGLWLDELILIFIIVSCHSSDIPRPLSSNDRLVLHLDVFADCIRAGDAIPFAQATANQGQSESYTGHKGEQYDWKDISILTELLVLGLLEITIAT